MRGGGDRTGVGEGGGEGVRAPAMHSVVSVPSPSSSHMKPDVHSEGSICAISGQVKPSGHSVHSSWRVALVKVPGTQSLGAVSPVSWQAAPWGQGHWRWSISVAYSSQMSSG